MCLPLSCSTLSRRIRMRGQSESAHDLTSVQQQAQQSLSAPVPPPRSPQGPLSGCPLQAAWSRACPPKSRFRVLTWPCAVPSCRGTGLREATWRSTHQAPEGFGVAAETPNGAEAEPVAGSGGPVPSLSPESPQDQSHGQRDTRLPAWWLSHKATTSVKCSVKCEVTLHRCHTYIDLC